MNPKIALRLKLKTVKQMNAEWKAETLIQDEIETFGVLVDEMRDLAEEYIKTADRRLLVNTMATHMGVTVGNDVPADDVRETAYDCLHEDGEKVIAWLEDVIELVR